MRWFGLFILCLIGMLGALSYQLFSILLQPIQTELAISDTAIGLINGLGIATVGAIAAFPIGWAADRYGRRLMLAASVLTWSAFVVVMGLAGSQTAFTVGAVGINLGDAALIPLLYGIVATAYVGKQRDLANAILVFTLTVGSAATLSLGGFLLQYFSGAPVADLAPWRTVCVAVALIGFIVTPFLEVVPGKGAPGQAQIASVASHSANDGFVDFFRANGVTISLTFFGITFYYVAFFTLLFWAPALLERRFGMSTAEASIALGTPLIFASIGGIVLANIGLALVRERWQEATPLRMVIIGCLVALLPAIGAAFATTGDQFIFALALMNLGVTISLSLAPTLLQSCAPDAFRSRTIAVFPIIALVVRVIFPAMIPWLSTRLGGEPQVLRLVNVITFVSCLLLSIIILKLIEPRYVALARDVSERDAPSRKTAYRTSLSV